MYIMLEISYILSIYIGKMLGITSFGRKFHTFYEFMRPDKPTKQFLQTKEGIGGEIKV